MQKKICQNSTKENRNRCKSMRNKEKEAVSKAMRDKAEEALTELKNYLNEMF